MSEDSSISNSDAGAKIEKNEVDDTHSKVIEYEYLTYETELPQPLRPANTELPPEPDVKKYSDPLKWSFAQKQSLVWQSVIGTVLTAYAAGNYAPPADQMAAEWHVSRVAILVGITMFTIGFGVAPMVLAPFSELNGRRPVFVISGLIYVLMQMCCALTHSYAGMLVLRLLGGMSSSVFSTMVGGVVADIYETKDRNTPMALFAGGVLFGTGLGPLIGGAIAQHITWRWVFGSHTIVLAAFMVIVVFFFRESRGSVLLSRKARKLNQWYEASEQAGSPGVIFPSSETKAPRRIRWKVKADEERATLAVMIKISTLRPFHLLFTEPTVFFFSLWISFSWGILYLQFSVIPYLFTTNYGFTLLQSNAIFTAVLITALLTTVLSIYQDPFLKHYFPSRATSPELRLYPAALESICLPIGLFWLGWTANPSIHWIVPTLGVSVASLGIFSIYLAVFNYLADAYGRYASSAIAGQSLCRNLLGGAFPLFAEQFYRNVGTGRASSILGALAVGLTGVPWVLAVFGPRVRARSRFASELAQGR